jgi:Putative  PD-(D/E)XK family member, (DUF4420)
MPLAADIFSSFTSLQPSASGASRSVSLHTIPFGESERHRLAKSAAEHPVLLIETSLPSGAYPAPLKLENLSVLHGYEGKVESNGGTVTGIFTVVECHVREAELIAAFLRLADHLLEGLPPLPDPRVVGFELRKLVHIFQALRQPPAKTIQGLWAELFVLANSPDIARWAAAWHVDPMDRYDFAMQRLRVEVKSSGNRTRRHTFSHEQLHPPKGVNLWIASVFVERTAAGSDCAGLLRRIQTCVSPVEAFRVESLVMCTLGSDFAKASDFKFDEALADQSLEFAPIENVPRLMEDVPAGISELRYSVVLPAALPPQREYPREE